MRKFFTWSRNDFFTGLLILLPLVGTVYIVKFLVSLLNNALLEPILLLIRPTFAQADEKYIILGVKIILFIVILLGIMLLGMLVKNLFIRQLFNFGEGILLRVPFINRIYSTIQQMISTFLMRKKDIFNKVVLVEYPRKGIFILGLFTSPCEGEIASKLPNDCVNVFIPTTPNPTSGFLIMLPRKDIQEMDISVEEAMKIIVSGGVVTPNGKNDT